VERNEGKQPQDTGQGLGLLKPSLFLSSSYLIHLRSPYLVAVAQSDIGNVCLADLIPFGTFTIPTIIIMGSVVSSLILGVLLPNTTMPPLTSLIIMLAQEMTLEFILKPALQNTIPGNLTGIRPRQTPDLPSIHPSIHEFISMHRRPLGIQVEDGHSR